ncbi:MAG TPA: tetratricopeptide repeat protein [Dyadobacter sp.]|jgi:tetratricopeptide (TPR) repeat protein|nr:tetratricopeptide repeat protein [Dyadobacter sp.]
MADQDLKEAEFAIKKAYKENYNQLLPILIPLDSILALPAKPQLENAIKKTSIVAEKHQNSKWVDNSYIILGKSRLYLGQWADGLEALRYVYANGKDENDKNDAMVVLMKAYVSRKDFSNALGVAEYLSRQPLSKATTRDFYLTKAYLHQQNGEYLTSVAILEETFPLLKKSIETARLHFAAAQMYDQLGQYALANKHYKAVSKNKPDYDLGFYASMNSLQNKVILDPKADLSSVGFEKMLNDRKNVDLLDRLYFTMGLLAEHKNNLPQAVEYLQKSAAANSGANKTQKAYTFLQLARINYESLEKFEASKMYYDSALVILPKEAPEYKLVADRKRALDSFVNEFTIVSREDSLQKLASMNPAALDNRIDDIIEASEKRRIEEEKKMKAAAAASANSQSGSGPVMDLSQRRWELYDPSMINQGKIDFRRVWGNRVLEDDWRRSSKQMRSATDMIAATSADSTAVEENIAMQKGSDAWLARHKELKSTVPLTPEMLAASHTAKENALYKLGKIYRFDLREDGRAVTTFTRVLNDYPKTVYIDEIYYLMYLSLGEENPEKPKWKDKLLAEFPNSTYARLVSKSPEKQGTMAAGGQVKEYEDTYRMYNSGDYTQALSHIENNMPAYKGSPLEDKFALLRVFLIGKVRGKDAYAQSITEFISLYPSSAYLPRLKEMQELSSLSAGRR